MRSSKRSTSVQAHTQTPLLLPHYIAASGIDVVEVGSVLMMIEDAALSYASLNGEDLVIWFLTPDEPPRLCSFVRALPFGGARCYPV